MSRHNANVLQDIYNSKGDKRRIHNVDKHGNWDVH